MTAMTATIAKPNDRLLRLALRANAIFSTTCALIALLGSGSLSGILGIPEPTFLPVLSGNLLVFAAFLVWLSMRELIPAGVGWGVVVADALWVVGTIPIVAGDVLTATGDTVAVLVAAFIAIWTVLQALGIRRMTLPPEPPRALGASSRSS